MSDYVIIEIPNFITSSGTRITYGYEYVPEHVPGHVPGSTNTQVNLDCIVINIDSSNKQNTNSTNNSAHSTYSNCGISKLNIYNLFPMLKPKFMSNYIIENSNIV